MLCSLIFKGLETVVGLHRFSQASTGSKLMKFTVYKISLGLLICALFLSACQLPTLPSSVTQTVSPLDGTGTPQTSKLLPTITPTPSPLRSLTVCLGQEPNSLYPYNNLNSAARSVLSAIYDGPIDIFANGYQPVILETIPSEKNGDLQVVPVEMHRGDPVVDSNGNRVTLSAGVTVFPSGCNQETCMVRYDGVTPLKMDQLIVTFRMLPGLLWSDGKPLTADDSVYAFKLASDPATPGSKYLVDRTQIYEAGGDKLTTQWWGVPGFIDPTYADNFWSPLPQHLWGTIKAADLVTMDTTKRSTVGWGPYNLVEWSAGQYIRLEKNPTYFRADKGFPKFDTLTFRFMQDAEAGISALVAGQCDLLDTSLRLDGQMDLLDQLEQNNQARVVVSPTLLIERLDFGIQQGSGKRANLFSDPRTRQGIASCLDRQKVVSTVLGDLTEVPNSFIPTKHPLYNELVTTYLFDTNKGSILLQEAGWVDADKNASTPRTALKVKDVPDGTPLVVNYWTTSALQRRQVSEILANSLSLCGVKVNVQYYDQNDFYAPGGAGPLFGRQFDLAEYAIGVNGSEPPCSWFLTSEIPTQQNNWVGVNVSGYSNPDYDIACKRAMRILPDKPEQKEAFDEVQVIFVNDLPSVPLYQRIKVVATRKDLCNLVLDSFSLNDLWNIEEIDFGPVCGN
jgi:peptide/nickel transport system substrate-binding protein